jgi:hypothetical protein
LNRIDDLVTVELLTSFIMWKLRENGKADSDVHSLIPVSPSLVRS